MTVSVTTKYNTTEGVCSTVIHVPYPVDAIVTVTQNVTSTQWWLEQTTSTRTETLTVNATSTDACYIPKKTPGGSSSTTTTTRLPPPDASPEPDREQDEDDDEEDNTRFPHDGI